MLKKIRWALILPILALVMSACVLSEGHGNVSADGCCQAKYALDADLSSTVNTLYWSGCNANYFGCWEPEMLYYTSGDTVGQEWVTDYPAVNTANWGYLFTHECAPGWCVPNNWKCFDWDITLNFLGHWAEVQNSSNWVWLGNWSCVLTH